MVLVLLDRSKFANRSEPFTVCMQENRRLLLRATMASALWDAQNSKKFEASSLRVAKPSTTYPNPRSWTYNDLQP